MNAPPRYHFSTEFSHFLNNLLNRVVFSLWRPLARLRAFSLLLLFFFIWHTLANRYTPVGFWDSLRSLGFGLQVGNLLIVRDTLVNFIWRHLFDLEALRDIVPIVFPFLLMRYRAAAYLEDIFELDDPEAALRFVDSAVFGIRYDSIVIQQGDVIREHRGSSILRIGGPGYVKVALDSAALFEYADGRPHVVTARKQVITLDGFERLQDIFDLRDHTYTFSVRERSLDGIWVEARDVRLIFSIWRGERSSSLEEPYPVAPQALEALFYDDASPVGQVYARTLHRPWPLKMQGLISSQLRSFISSNLLENFIASQEPPRLDDGIGRASSPAGNELGSVQKHFFSRSEISGQVNLRADVPNYFLLFAQNFNARAKRQGVELKWNGIGTWILPDETLQRRNLDAWYLTRQNLQKMSPYNLQRERETASIEKLRTVVQDYVINPDIGNRAYGQRRWQKDVFYIILLLKNIAREDCPATGMHTKPIIDAIEILKGTRSHFINPMAQQRTQASTSVPQAPSDAESEVLDVDGLPAEANPTEEVMAAIQQVLGVENTRIVLEDMRRRYGEETNEADLISALSICLGEVLSDFEKSGQSWTPDTLTRILRQRIQNGECPPES